MTDITVTLQTGESITVGAVTTGVGVEVATGTGLRGAVGFTGSTGTGFVGSTGNTGFTGSQGIGFTGSTGNIGFVGSTGNIGFTGSQGIGFTGSIGNIGFTGSTGNIGFTGSTGSIGFTGSSGTLGYTGSQGAGFVGSTGNTGSLGYTGSAGANGTNANTGNIIFSNTTMSAANSKLEFNSFGPATIYLTTVTDDTTTLLMGPVTAELRAHTSVSIATDTSNTGYTWAFGQDGVLTLPGPITGNAAHTIGNTTINGTLAAGNITFSNTTMSATNTLSFSTNGIEAMRITSGTIDGEGGEYPGELQVSGQARFGGAGGTFVGSAGIRVGPDRGSSIGDAFVIFYTSGNTGVYDSILTRGGGGPNANLDLINRGTGSIAITAENAGAVVTKTNNTERMRVTSGGNVGIGNTAPASTLVVAGTVELGNTTITGFANVTSTIRGGSSLTIAGAASGITTLAAGNTTITGFANVTTGVNSAILSVGTSFIANSTTVTTTGLFVGNTGDNFAIGYRDVPQNFTNTNYTFALTDAGKHILTQNSGSSTQTLTLPNNAIVAYQTGAAIAIVVQSTGTVALANGAGVTMYLAGNSTAKSSITLNSYSQSTALKISTDTWFVTSTSAV